MIAGGAVAIRLRHLIFGAFALLGLSAAFFLLLLAFSGGTDASAVPGAELTVEAIPVDSGEPQLQPEAVPTTKPTTTTTVTPIVDRAAAVEPVAQPALGPATGSKDVLAVGDPLSVDPITPSAAPALTPAATKVSEVRADPPPIVATTSNPTTPAAEISRPVASVVIAGDPAIPMSAASKTRRDSAPAAAVRRVGPRSDAPSNHPPHEVAPQGVGSGAPVTPAAPVAPVAPVTPPAPAPAVPAPAAPTSVRNAGSSGSSSDASRHLHLLLYAVGATTIALELRRSRRALQLVAVMPRPAFSAPIERPG